MDEAEAMVTRILRKAPHPTPAPSAQPLNAPGAWDFFLSHGQAAAGDQVKMLCFLLRQRGKKVWYDNEMANRSTAAMEEGVKHSAHFLLFLSGDPPIATPAPASGPSSPVAGSEPEPEPEPEPDQLLASAPPEGVPPSPAPTSEAAFAALLQQLDVAAYAAALAEECIQSADDLRELTADDLKELGFKMGDRKRVLKWGATQ